MNVNGLGDNVKRRQVFKYLNNKKVDIACLQETHAVKKYHKIWKAQYNGTIVFSDGTTNTKGVAILFNKSIGISESEIDIDKDNEGRYIIATFKYSGKSMSIINVYAPNNDDPDFYAEVLSKAERNTADYVSVMGDFNVWLNPELDKKGGTEANKSKAAEIVNSFLEEENWVDIWRSLNPDRFCYTYKKWNPRLILTRLDYVIAPINTAMIINKCEVLPAILSDHCPIMCEMLIDPTVRGRGLWKFNTQHLKNKEYVENVNEILQKAQFRYINLDASNRWEMAKNDVKLYSMNFSTHVASQKKIKVMNLEAKLKTANKKLANINLSSHKAVQIIQKTNEMIDEIKSELQKISLIDTQGAMLRSKARYMAEGEHCTKYFFQLEKSRAKSKTMTSTYDAMGNIESNPNKILTIQRAYFEQLYSDKSSVDCQLTDKPPTRLSNEESLELDQELTMNELEIVVKAIAQGKSPGNSGFQVDFYIVFWKHIKDLLLEAFKMNLKIGKMSESQRQGIISLIPKKDCDLKFVKSWRPIILLNIDFKILAKVYANRLKKVLDKLVHKQQTGFLKGRNITDNLRQILDVVNYTSIEDIPAVLISVDFEKAYDKVRYNSLFKIMECLILGQK